MTPTIELDVQRMSHDSEHGSWEFAFCRPRGFLAEYVDSFWYVDGTANWSVERVVPRGDVVIMFNLGPSQRLIDRSGEHQLYHRAWVAGQQESYLELAPVADSTMIGARLRPAGSWAVFGRPIDEMTNRVIELDLVLGSDTERIRQQLYDQPLVDRRFGTMAGWLARRIISGPALDPSVSWSVDVMTRVGGDLRIGDVAASVGMSRRRFIDRFRRQIGLTPKSFSRILRFNHAIDLLTEKDADLDLTGVALDCGYFDQAHFNRDFRAFSGVTPTAYLRELNPNGDGLMHES